MKPGKKRMRLMTAIPFSLFIFSLVSGLSTLRLTFIYSPSIISAGGVSIALWVLLVSGFALVVGIVLTLAIVRPINKMIEQAVAILPEDGMLPSKAGSENEIESLVSVFERLVSSLDQRTMSAERAQIELVRQKIHRVEYLANMGAFSLGLVHEIKNPLGYLQGLVELIDRDLGDGDRKKEYVNTIIRGIERLNKLANDLLSIARIDQMKLEQISVERVMKEALAVSEYKYSWKKIRIQQNYDGNSQGVYGSHEKLIQVFSNILTNALEATPEGGEIVIPFPS